MYAAYKFSHFAINLPKLNLSQFDEVLTETKMHSFFETRCSFCPVTLRTSAAYAVVRCPSVCLSVRHVRVFCRNE